VEQISDLSGLARDRSRAGAGAGGVHVQMAGIPPLSGFFGKLYMFLAAVQSGLWALAVIGVLTSVVGAFYYMRIIKVMYFDRRGSVRSAPGLAVLRRRGHRAVHRLLLPVPKSAGNRNSPNCVSGRLWRARWAVRIASNASTTAAG
jgi:NADH:ubiquinone oxidoreductase subunit 2 (subunit N)